MKKLCVAIVGLAAVLGSISAESAGWTNNFTIDRIGPRYDADKIFIVVKGSNYANTCEDTNAANVTHRWVELKISADPDKIVYSTLLSLFSTGKQATFYIDQGCNVKYVQTCGTTSCTNF